MVNCFALARPWQSWHSDTCEPGWWCRRRLHPLLERLITDPNEGLIRRARRRGGQRYVIEIKSQANYGFRSLFSNLAFQKTGQMLNSATSISR